MAQQKAEEAMRSHPIYQAFIKGRSGFRDLWVGNNPEVAIELMNSEAEKMRGGGLEWWEKMLLWQPTERQRNMMMAWQASQSAQPAQPAGG